MFQILDCSSRIKHNGGELARQRTYSNLARYQKRSYCFIPEIGCEMSVGH